MFRVRPDKNHRSLLGSPSKLEVANRNAITAFDSLYRKHPLTYPPNPLPLSTKSYPFHSRRHKHRLTPPDIESRFQTRVYYNFGYAQNQFPRPTSMLLHTQLASP